MAVGLCWCISDRVPRVPATWPGGVVLAESLDCLGHLHYWLFFRQCSSDDCLLVLCYWEKGTGDGSNAMESSLGIQFNKKVNIMTSNYNCVNITEYNLWQKVFRIIQTILPQLPSSRGRTYIVIFKMGVGCLPRYRWKSYFNTFCTLPSMMMIKVWWMYDCMLGWPSVSPIKLTPFLPW